MNNNQDFLTADQIMTKYFKHDEEKAVECLEILAKRNDSSAFLQLSFIYCGFALKIKPDIPFSKTCCESARKLNHPEAEFRLKVSCFIEGTFDTKLNFCEGIENAIKLKEKGNDHAVKFLASLKQSSSSALLEIFELEDLNFLKSQDLWSDDDSEDDNDE